MSKTLTQIKKNYLNITERIEGAALDCGRKPKGITLIAVSKVQPKEKIDAILQTNQRIFGENRVQEAMQRWAERKTVCPDLKLHLIGPLQTNKVKEAVAFFDVIETLDRVKLAQKLKVEMDKTNRHLPLFIQVNTGEEPQKAGIAPLELPDFFEYAVKELSLDVRGLMCIPPVGEPAGLHFGLLKNWADKLALKEISMGMSDDFEEAIKFGATYVRVGSALFGERDYDGK